MNSDMIDKKWRASNIAYCINLQRFLGPRPQRPRCMSRPARRESYVHFPNSPITFSLNLHITTLAQSPCMCPSPILILTFIPISVMLLAPGTHLFCNIMFKP